MSANLISIEKQDSDYKLHRRFDRMGRLVGDGPMQTLLNAHVLIVGLGGVGSFAAESIARSGVGTITIVDFDLICITNANRQLHAMQGLTGKPKADVMAERLRRINPRAVIHSHPVFFDHKSSAALLNTRPDYVIDAIDHITTKCHLLSECRKRGLPVVTSTGSGGRIDPTQIDVADLQETKGDPLAKAIRRVLRAEHNFPTGKTPFGIPAVFF